MQNEEIEVTYGGWTVLVCIFYLYKNRRPDSLTDLGWYVVRAIHDDEEENIYDGFSFDECSCTANFGRAVLEAVQGRFDYNNFGGF